MTGFPHAQETRPYEISVLICTFHRPGLLYGLLEALLVQVNAPAFEVIIVDNDAAGSAAVAADKPQFAALNIRYEIEPRSGISFARNRAVALAQGSWLALIDDDERPQPDWLEQLFKAQQTLPADVIFGPVLPYYSEGVPDWILRGKFLDRARHATGTVPPDSEMRSGNVLLRAAILNDDLRFDPSLARTGGEDVMLFRNLRNRGAQMFWCDEAVVVEYQPQTRYQLRWLLKWRFKGGANFVDQELSTELHGRQRWRNAAYVFTRAVVLLFVSGLGVMLTSPAAVLPSLRHWPVFFLARFAAQLGKISAGTGYRLEAYGTPPARPAATQSPADLPDSVITPEEDAAKLSPQRPERRLQPRWPD